MAAAHLGRPEDLPARSLAALRSADLLIFEEDRPARSFLKAAGVHRDYLKYSEHREALALEECAAALKRGAWVLYMSDQGTPGLADPGRDLVELAFTLGAKLEVIPGPSSVAAAISACPFDCTAFHFIGFLPREEEHRAAALAAAADFGRPLVLMDTPYRLKALLATGAAVFGTSRRAFVALDITGEAEDYWCGTFKELGRRAEALETKLNFVLIIDAKTSERAPKRRR